MKRIKATLEMDGVMSTPLMETELEINEDLTDFQIDLLAAHKLTENLKIITMEISEPD